MKIFKNKLIDTLSTINPKEKKSSIIAIWIYKTLIKQNAFLWAQKILQNLKFGTNFLELCELQYFAWYRNYMKIILTRLWQHACEIKTDDWELLSRRYYLSKIAISLKIKVATLKNICFNYSTARKAADYCTYTIVCNVSRSLSILKEVAIWSIIEYGLGNKKFHQNLKALCAKRDFQQLANVFSADIKDLYLVFSESCTDTDKKYLKSVITAEIQ